MNFVIALAAIIALTRFDGILGYSIDWYKNAVQTEVFPPYKTAYEALQSKIIDPLLNANVTLLSDESNGAVLVANLARQLSCGVNNIRSKLDETLTKSDAIGKNVDTDVLAIVTSISTTEQNIAQQQNTIASLNTQIGQVQQQVAIGEQAVRDKEAGVSAADRDLQAAQQAVDDARRCRGKRFLGSIFKPITQLINNVIVKPICSVVNSGGIDRAKDRRGDAERQLASARQQLDNYRTQLTNVRNTQGSLQNQLAQSKAQVTSLSATLDQLRAQQVVITNISAELRQVTSRLSTIISSTTVLQKIIEGLIDFELLITPLNAVYTGMYQGGLLTGIAGSDSAVLITADTITKIRANLDTLAVKLSTIPFNVDGAQAC